MTTSLSYGIERQLKCEKQSGGGIGKRLVLTTY